MEERFKSFVIDIDIPSSRVDEEDIYPEDYRIASKLLATIKHALRSQGFKRYYISVKKLIVIDDGAMIYEKEIISEDKFPQKQLTEYIKVS